MRNKFIVTTLLIAIFAMGMNTLCRALCIGHSAASVTHASAHKMTHFSEKAEEASASYHHHQACPLEKEKQAKNDAGETIQNCDCSEGMGAFADVDFIAEDTFSGLDIAFSVVSKLGKEDTRKTFTAAAVLYSPPRHA